MDAHSIVPGPWRDRGDSPAAGAPSPRSQRDLEILRALARRINPQDAGAHNNLGVVYYNKGLYEDAVRHFERALELDPRMQVAERNLQIAYFGTGHFERLRTELRARLDADPSDDVARDELARTYFNSGELNGAISELRLLLLSRPRDAGIYQRLARAELKRGDLDAALVALRNAEALEPDNARIQFMIGETHYTRGLSDDAREALERAVALDPNYADAHHLLAFVYGDLGEDSLAERASDKAIELNPSFRKAEAGLSLDSYSTARYEELIGERSAAPAPAVAEGGELAHYNLGLAFRQKALYDEALREFRLASERGEDTLLVQQAQAEMLLLRGDSAPAVEMYRRLVEHEASSPKLWNELGVAHHQAGNLAEAAEAYGQALELDPAYALAWNNLGVVRHHLGDGTAEAAFRTAVDEGRALADVWRNFALMLHRTGRLAQSAEAYARATSVRGAGAQAHTGYGILLMELGRVDEARTELLRAVELDPNLPEARYHLAFVLSAKGDYDGALRETELALQLNPYIPVPRFRLLIDLQFEEVSLLAPELDAAERISGGEAIRSFHFQAGSLDSVFAGDDAADGASGGSEPPAEHALRAARTALEQGQLDVAGSEAQRAALFGANRLEVLLIQGEVYLRRGFSGEAVERFNEVLAEIARGAADDRDDALHRALQGAARSMLDLGRMAEAVEAAERLVELVPGDVEALRTLGDALFRVKDFARAAIVFEHARLTAPDDVHLLTQLGSAYAAAGDPEGAESALRRALMHDPGAVSARTVLADVLAEEERVEEAEQEYREALHALPSFGEAAFRLAALLERKGREQDAIHVMADLLIADPYHLDAVYRLGELLVAAGQSRQARFAFERVLRFNPKDQRVRDTMIRVYGVRG